MEQTTKKWLLIQNKGEIDPNALVLMGGSTKRDDDTKIGLFGSGNKYSIALLLKAGIEFKIFSGEREILITTEDVEFRNKKFKKILVDGKETSLTTDMGPQWDTWMAVREFASNSIDEGDYTIVSSTENINAVAGCTRIYIEHTPEIKEVIEKWNLYFSFDRTDVIVEDNQRRIYPNIAENNARILYRKGIRCQNEGKSLYHYDLPDFPINESRVIDSVWAARRYIARAVVSIGTKDIASGIMKNAFGENNYMETALEYSGDTWGVTMSQGWRDAIGDRIIVNVDLGGFYADKIARHPHFLVSKELAKKIQECFPDVQVYGVGDDKEVFTEKVDSTPKMQYQLKKAMEALAEMRYHVTYPIEVVKFSDNTVLGQAKNSIIYLSEKVFDKGIREVALTIMEENEHLLTGHRDATRAFQDHLFNKLLSAMEEQHGIFL